MNESVTWTDAFTWFQRHQLEAVMRNGVVPQWFHGIISRKASEELLMSKPPGYFLIRVSESRIGYTLSYRAEDRCRHFMIDAMKDGYIILGDDRHHRFLEDLVDFHRKFPIKPFSEFLTLPCGQISDVHTDYDELLFPKIHINSSPNFPQLQTQKSIPDSDAAPVLPCRPAMMNSPAQSSQPSRLYPSLDLLQSAMPQAVPYTASTSIPSHSPELPSRNVNPIPKKNQPGTRTNTALPSLPKDHREPKDSLTSVVTNLKKFKKKLHRKSSSTEQAVYEEVAVKEDVKSETNEYHEIADHQFDLTAHAPNSCSLKSAELPQEYLPPPPFAPGYK